MAAFVAGSPLLLSQQDAFRDHSRVPGMNELHTSFDFEAVASRSAASGLRLHRVRVDGEFTLRRNRQAYDWVELVPRRIASVNAPQTALELFGTKMAFPIMVSPPPRIPNSTPKGNRPPIEAVRRPPTHP